MSNFDDDVGDIQTYKHTNLTYDVRVCVVVLGAPKLFPVMNSVLATS